MNIFAKDSAVEGAESHLSISTKPQRNRRPTDGVTSVRGGGDVGGGGSVCTPHQVGPRGGCTPVALSQSARRLLGAGPLAQVEQVPAPLDYEDDRPPVKDYVPRAERIAEFSRDEEDEMMGMMGYAMPNRNAGNGGGRMSGRTDETMHSRGGLSDRRSTPHGSHADEGSTSMEEEETRILREISNSSFELNQAEQDSCSRVKDKEYNFNDDRSNGLMVEIDDANDSSRVIPQSTKSRPNESDECGNGGKSCYNSGGNVPGEDLSASIDTTSTGVSITTNSAVDNKRVPFRRNNTATRVPNSSLEGDNEGQAQTLTAREVLFGRGSAKSGAGVDDNVGGASGGGGVDGDDRVGGAVHGDTTSSSQSRKRPADEMDNNEINDDSTYLGLPHLRFNSRNDIQLCN